MAYKHDDKSSGQLIRSADWNTMGHEIERLETDKVNRVGDTIKGDLTVTGQAQLGSLAVTGDANVGNLKVTGERIKSADGFGIVQTNAKDWLRINPDSHYPSIALYNPVAIGAGGLSIGDWSQMPQGQLKVTGQAQLGGAVTLGNSDLYFSKTDHNHTGLGNTDGWAAIENAKNYDALMILGRAHAGGKRLVKLWDYLEVNGDSVVNGNSVVNGLLFVNSPSGNRLIMQGDGNLVIYRSNGTAWWNSQTNVSDSRLKKDIRSIERPLEKLLSFSGISFSWVAEELGSERELGVLADEVEKVFPELVYSLDKKYKSVKYQGLIAVLIEAIKEQQATILRFGEEIQNLKGTLKPNPA